MIKMVSMILGGGAGTRLYPLTEQRSKPAVPVGGKYRLIDIPISNCLNSGVKRMFVLTQFNSASLNKHIKNTYHFDLFSHGFVDILAAEQTPGDNNWFQGTADAVKQCMKHLSSIDYDYILILSGDQLYQMDLEAFAKEHVAKKAEISIATIPVTAADAPAFGIMKVNADGMIDSFVEKPKAEELSGWESEVSAENKEDGKVYLASMGIYIFSKNVIKDLFKEYDKATDFGKEIIPSAITSGKSVASYEYSGYWEDIGSIINFFEANLDLTGPLPPFNLFDNEKIIHTRPRKLPASKIFGTTMNQAVLADGCIVNAKSIENAIVGIRCRIKKDTFIKNAIIFGNDYYELAKDVDDPEIINMGIGKDCFIQNAIIDKNVRIGDNVTIIGSKDLKDTREETYCVVAGVIVLRKGATIPSGTVIGKKRGEKIIPTYEPKPRYEEAGS